MDTVRETRWKVAEQLLDFLDSRAPVYFVGESTVHSQQPKLRTWMKNSRDIILLQTSISCTRIIYVYCSNIITGRISCWALNHQQVLRKVLEELRWAQLDDIDRSDQIVLDGKSPTG